MAKKQDTTSNIDSVVKNARKQIVRSTFFALAALGVIVIACYAWFVSSGQVTAKMSGFSIAGDMFELASTGSKAYPDGHLALELRPSEGMTWTAPDKSTGTVTGQSKDIFWRMSDSSNIGNQDNKGIQPGSSNNLEFYVVPHVSGQMRLRFTLQLEPLSSTGDLEKGGQLERIENNETLQRLLKGHILFFQKDGEQLTWINADTGSFEITFDATKDEPHLVTLYWTWPYLLNVVTKWNDVVAYMEKSPATFFYNGGKEIPAVDLENNFSQFDGLFNAADEYIGTNAAGIFLSLNAELL